MNHANTRPTKPTAHWEKAPPTSAPREGATYWLEEHVYGCVTPDGAVFLDLKLDKYLGLAASQANALAGVVHGWPEDIAGGAHIEDAGREIAEALLKEGLLTRDERRGKNAAPPTIDRGPQVSEAECIGATERSIRLLDVWRFLVACLQASWMLRFRSLRAAVAHVAAIRGCTAKSPLTDDAAALSSIFRRLRIYVFPKRNQCLYHALALVVFMAHYGVHVTWVIGIRTSPFAAHSWVQDGVTLFDAMPAEVLSYTPILAV